MKVAAYVREGMGRSFHAECAERTGRIPLTRAIAALSRRGWAKHAVRQALEESWDGEWHHVGKYATECPYYSLRAAEAELLEACAFGGFTILGKRVVPTMVYDRAAGVDENAPLEERRKAYQTNPVW